MNDINVSQDFTDRLNRMMADILGDVGGAGTYGPTGTLIMALKGKSVYHYYSVGTHKFAYTSYPDVNGDYFAWTYKPKGKGSRTDPQRWVAKDIVSFKHKGKAMRRAEKRMDAYAAKLRKE